MFILWLGKLSVLFQTCYFCKCSYSTITRYRVFEPSSRLVIMEISLHKKFDDTVELARKWSEMSGRSWLLVHFPLVPDRTAYYRRTRVNVTAALSPSRELWLIDIFLPRRYNYILSSKNTHSLLYLSDSWETKKSLCFYNFASISCFVFTFKFWY